MTGLLLRDKVVIVTGGSGLIGKNLIRGVIENGGTGIIADINEKASKDEVNRIKKELNSEKADHVKLNIVSEKSVKNMIKYVKDKYGKIDGVVNSAYPRTRNFGREFEKTTYKDFCADVNLQLGGYFLVSQQCGIYFRKQGYGNIINLSSIYGVIAPRFEIYGGAEFHGIKMGVPVEYAAIKSAIVHMTKFIAKYYKGCNVRVNCITPGGVLDNQPKEFLKKYNYFGMSKGMINAEDLKGAAVFLLSDGARAVNGQNIIVDDGWTL